MTEHKHLIIRAEVNNPPTIPKDAEQWLLRLVQKIDMKLLTCIGHNPNSGYCTVDGNRGLTAIALIETSHIILHSWDEAEPALLELDLYSCKDFNIDYAIKHLGEFNPTKIEYMFIDRTDKLVLLSQN